MVSIGCAGSGRQAAQGTKDYRDSGRVRERNDDKIVIKEEVIAADETDALERLKAANTSGPYRCAAYCLQSACRLACVWDWCSDCSTYHCLDDITAPLLLPVWKAKPSRLALTRKWFP